MEISDTPANLTTDVLVSGGTSKRLEVSQKADYPIPTALEVAEARVRLLQIENRELQARVDYLETMEERRQNEKPKTQEWLGVPVLHKAASIQESGMPNFTAMTQGQLGTYAKVNAIDISNCKRATEIIDTLEKAWKARKPIAQ